MSGALSRDMLRITENFEDDNTVRLRLDGSISDTSFAEVEEAFTRHAGNSRRGIVVLDMAGVVFMNNDAAKKMVQLRNEHVRIINCSPFIETLLDTVAGARCDHVHGFKS
jgi:anti-anti-sigma regulatory factor